MDENNSICIKINSWPQYYRAPSASLFTIGSVSTNLFNSWPPPDQIRSNQTKISSASLSTTGPVQVNFFNSWPPSDQMKALANTPFYHRSHTDQHFNSWPSRSTRTPPALRPIIGPYRPTFDFFSAEITPRRQHHMKIFDDFHIEGYFHRFFPSWDWILNLFHFIFFYIQWLVISFWSFSLMKQSYWEKWLLMIELFEKFWKVVVFRRQVCHNQYWLHTDYKPESIKK